MAGNPNEAPCGVKEGDIVSPDARNQPQYSCSAIVLDEVTGVKFLTELGKPENQRTHKVGTIYDGKCAQMVENGTCPVLNTSATIFPS